ncbi:putative FAD-linked oxidoreductase [Variibacter gotjawalensis]|uniref:D-lactate dehydrogenase (cytochrome) n=1 Tax=Variibacter gotjawalensis TaxID=1333996 RepID=A0A0S3PTT3_9BRAD|nr:FAD-linked oxidase C-terminal domain-containing protein [Variibacter gotjawalensis]NIK49653.1 D-lactate dehydrogenase (cytochrome) [Variibacter gotjawalensis]RZS45665.1 D-lactate dehydrogenase (cytochrome) [Variibacter gotjawalensis]BAT59336.1 putative FAD-linked oxidoreductase [Variibacter gotjawalensis]
MPAAAAKVMPMTEQKPSKQAVEAVVAGLNARFGNRVVTSLAVREQHANTTTWLANQPPDVVVFPHSTEEVQDIVKLCAEHGVPVIPFGTGTSLEGHVNAPLGGVSVDFRDMNKVLEVHAQDLDCVVQPGVTRKQLNDYLRDQGLFFPIDPGADASIGGMTATRASGTNAVRYGTMKDNVISVKAVLANGEVITTARRAKKSSAGYDLTRLFIGSEGTLGVITEITLKLHGIPEAISSAVCPFESIQGACDATIMTIQSGIPVARIELLDVVQVRASNAYSKLTLKETPHLFLEFHGTEASVAEQAERFAEIAAECGGGPSEWTTKPEERTKLWQARHDSYWSMLQLRPGAKGFATDVCVPISRLAECVLETCKDIEEYKLVAPIVGHVGDGNFHVGVMIDMNDPAEVKNAKTFIERLAKRAIAMDGTCTGEHGVGQGKIKYLEAEHGRTALNAMTAIKQALDPQNLMNPGKILPSSLTAE